MSYGSDLPQRLSAALKKRFEDDPDRWSLTLRLDLAEHLRSAGVDASWYEETLRQAEIDVASHDVYSRLDDIANLVGRYKRNENRKKAGDLALTLFPMAFGVGYRKDYQFDSWVAWLGRALAEPEGERFVDDAAWLASVLTAADPMTEGTPGFAAVTLPATVARQSPLRAVRVFEYLVRHGTVHHLDAFAALVRGLLAHTSANDEPVVDLAASITANLHAPAANKAYPEVAETLVAAAGRVGTKMYAAALAESVASDADKFALPTTRRTWREGLGIPTSTAEPDPKESGSTGSDYGTLELSDGTRIARSDVPPLVHSAEDILDLREKEASGSSFSWAQVVDQQTLTGDEVRALLDVFDDGAERSEEALASLADAAERSGDDDLALQLAYRALRSTPPNSWSRHYGGARRRAAATAVRIGGRDACIAACQNLVEHVATNRWAPALLLSELDDIISALDPKLPRLADVARGARILGRDGSHPRTARK